MFVIRLPNGNLMVPQTATGNDGRILGDVYVEIGPQDADYARLAEQQGLLASRGPQPVPGHEPTVATAYDILPHCAGHRIPSRPGGRGFPRRTW